MRLPTHLQLTDHIYSLGTVSCQWEWIVRSFDENVNDQENVSAHVLLKSHAVSYVSITDDVKTKSHSYHNNNLW